MYIISSASRRREFDTLKEAMAVKVEGDDIYESDAFGNCTPLSPDRVQELMTKEASEQPATPAEPPKQADNPQATEAQPKVPQPKEVKPPEQPKPVKEKPKWMIYLKYALYAGIVIVALYLLMTAALPALDGLLNIYNNVLG